MNKIVVIANFMIYLTTIFCIYIKNNRTGKFLDTESLFSSKGSDLSLKLHPKSQIQNLVSADNMYLRNASDKVTFNEEYVPNNSTFVHFHIDENFNHVMIITNDKACVNVDKNNKIVRGSCNYSSYTPLTFYYKVLDEDDDKVLDEDKVLNDHKISNDVLYNNIINNSNDKNLKGFVEGLNELNDKVKGMQLGDLCEPLEGLSEIEIKERCTTIKFRDCSLSNNDQILYDRICIY